MTPKNQIVKIGGLPIKTIKSDEATEIILDFLQADDISLNKGHITAVFRAIKRLIDEHGYTNRIKVPFLTVNPHFKEKFKGGKIPNNKTNKSKTVGPGAYDKVVLKAKLPKRSVPFKALSSMETFG